MSFHTHIASLDAFDKGSIDLNDDLKHYAFSNIFEVASQSAPYERVMVVSNLEYCAEAVRAEGESAWYTAPHDEFAVVMDGEIEFTFHELTPEESPRHSAGAAKLDGKPFGPRMGVVRARRGHQVLLPAGAAYRMAAARPSVALIQTLQGPESIERWSQICTLGLKASTITTAKQERNKHMNTQEKQTVIASEPDPVLGYRTFKFGGFTFHRDAYFVHVSWPKGTHTMEVDRFLRAMVRDIGWGFFYGWIFFDDVFGTQNHYGTVDIFAGTYSKGHKTTGVDYLENFTGEDVRQAFEAISRDWINEGYDPLRAPLETGSPLGPKTREAEGPLIRGFQPARHMLGLPDDVQPRSDASGHPINRAFADMKMDQPDIEVEPGFEGRLNAINLYDHIARADVTWNPSFTAVTGASICCVTSEEHMLPVIHGNDRNEWFVQLTDEIHWNIQDKDTGNPRGRIVMKSGDVCAMPADIRHQGFAPKRAMLMVLENGTPDLAKRYAAGELDPFPISADRW